MQFVLLRFLIVWKLERQQSEKKVQLEGEKKKKKKPYELEEMLSR
jgi:hypothetical protein